jgi:N-acetylneuraminate lyase
MNHSKTPDHKEQTAGDHRSKLAGIVTALVSIFDDKDRFNSTAQRELVQYNLKLGVRCFYVCGTTGESFSMSKEERMKVAAAVRNEASGEGAAVIVNVSHMEYRVVLELIEHARSIGADAVSLLPPIYFPISNDELMEYWLSILDRASPMPATIYNIPSLTGCALTEAMVRRLAERPNFIGVKHSTEDTFLLNRFKQVDGGRLLIWNGRDAYCLGGLAMGADGAIGSSFNLLGDLFIALTKTFRAGRNQDAVRIQELINSVHSRLQPNGHIKSIKFVLSQLGIDAGVCRLPYGRLSADGMADLIKAIKLLQTVREQVHRIARS